MQFLELLGVLFWRRELVLALTELACDLAGLAPRIDDGPLVGVVPEPLGHSLALVQSQRAGVIGGHSELGLAKTDCGEARERRLEHRSCQSARLCNLGARRAGR